MKMVVSSSEIFFRSHFVELMLSLQLCIRANPPGARSLTVARFGGLKRKFCTSSASSGHNILPSVENCIPKCMPYTINHPKHVIIQFCGYCMEPAQLVDSETLAV